LEQHLLDEVSLFFSHYKKLEKTVSVVKGWKNSKAAKKAIERAINLFQDKNKK
jgi:inorganic pyrophosphatase